MAPKIIVADLQIFSAYISQSVNQIKLLSSSPSIALKMSDIPSEFYREILLRLPADSLFRFRTVCKAWRRIIDDPSFIKSHTNNQHSSTTLFIRNPAGTLYSISLDSLNYIDGLQKIEVIHVKTLSLRGVPRLPALPVASCNGLILISHFEINKIWVIWNPLTKEFHELPELDIDEHLKASGLGYDSASDDYKVVRIDEIWHNQKLWVNNQKFYRTLVYSMKSDSWKRIKNCPGDFAIAPIGSDQGFFLNGALHWRSRDKIITLDLATEEYRQLSLPPVPRKPGKPFETYLDALGGCLVVSFYYIIERLDGWVMKDYGVEKSWTKLFSFGKLDVIGAMQGNLRPVAYFKSKGQVVLQYYDKFFWLDIEKNISKKVTILGIPSCFSSQICPGSLFRLSDSVGGSVALKSTAGVKRKRRNRKKANTRLHDVIISDIWCRSDSSFSSDSGWLSEGEDY
ncbi:hypothetical protein DH2020_030656 [Rehmannia glutinosa]|uniref:F-box domain-containing protein n=1 Tax=Rehmannia glutinosa TaxID=99300 RepID=A0ABR0VKB3_REHGL